MTKHYVRLLGLLIATASTAPAYCGWTALWSYEQSSTIFSIPVGDFNNIPNTPSLSVPLTNLGAGELPYVGGSIFIKGQVSLFAVDRSFSIFTSANVRDTTPGFGSGNGMEVNANLGVEDTMRCIVDSSHHRIKMTTFWNLHGDMSTTATGHYSATTPPTAQDYVNASARSELRIFGTGVGDPPPPLGPGSLWGDSWHEFDSSVTVDENYDKKPPLEVPQTLFFENNVDTAYDFNVSASTIASLNDQNLVNHQGGEALAVINLAHTFTWGGVTSVTDADTGEPIANWTLTSDSGTDWAHAAVPEPTTLITALAGIVFLRRSALVQCFANADLKVRPFAAYARNIAASKLSHYKPWEAQKPYIFVWPPVR